MRNIVLIALALAGSGSAVAATPDLSQAAIDKTFGEMDANHDGHVDKAEYTKYFQARAGHQTAQVDAAIKELDKDKDGKISKAEAAAVPQLAKYFSELDTDKDGFLSRQEMQNAMMAAQVMGAK